MKNTFLGADLNKKVEGDSVIKRGNLIEFGVH